MINPNKYNLFNLYFIVIGLLAKYIVSFLVLFFILSDTSLFFSLYYLIFSLVSALFGKIVKYLVKELRPDCLEEENTSLFHSTSSHNTSPIFEKIYYKLLKLIDKRKKKKKSYGMPSSHSLSIFYFFTLFSIKFCSKISIFRIIITLFLFFNACIAW